MNPLLLIAASTLALAGVAACSPGKPAARVALECPESEGDLTRMAAAADGRSCTYRTAEGGEVALQLVSTNGNPESVLRTIEASLEGPIPEGTAAAGSPAEGPDVQPATAAPGSASDAAAVARQAEADAGRAPAAAPADSDRKTANAQVDVRIGDRDVVKVTDADGRGEVTQVRLPGIDIVAGEEDAKVKIGGVTIDAGEDRLTMRNWRDVRLKGEALSREKRGFRATFMRHGELQNGYEYVGYEAGGPRRGPITVAVVKSRVDLEDVRDDVTRLVRRNGGV
jgi:hypothetical protein